ncbi:hypothetical protein BGZ76_002855, partial [Entomortierella beljakovae]
MTVAKTACILAAFVAYVNCHSPTPSSRNVSVDKGDKIFQLTIRKGHKLVEAGPYKFLRHPSYTGGVLNMFFFHTLLLNEGIIEVGILVFRKVLALGMVDRHGTNITIPTSYFGIGGGIWLAGIYASIMLIMFSIRIRNEEVMLKAHFGEEWTRYA